MHLLVLNNGTSSLKYGIFSIDAASGNPVGSAPQLLAAGQLQSSADEDANHGTKADQLLQSLLNEATLPTIDAVGHRVVHGADHFDGPVLIDDEVRSRIAELGLFAPLHNPADLAVIEQAQRWLPNALQLAVFDTSFHRTLPPQAYTYAVPSAWTNAGIRRYGFHGISVSYVCRRTARLLKRPLEQLNLIVLHLGSGASATAVANGRSVETSMGITPLEGLVMSRRSGDIDPSVIDIVSRQTGRSFDSVAHSLVHESGLHGLCGTADMREVWQRADAGEEDATLAIEVYCHRLRKYIGAYTAVLGHLDAIVFTGGVGEHDARLRQKTVESLTSLGINIDPSLNDRAEGECSISSPASPVRLLVVPTNEEQEIARQIQQFMATSGQSFG